jgi:integrase
MSPKSNNQTRFQRGIRTQRLRLIQYRDGLLIAIFASRARRLRSMALLRIGYELFRFEEHYRVELQPDRVKTRKYDIFGLPERLTPYMEHYLSAIRSVLLANQIHEMVWVKQDGKPLSAKGIQAAICKRSKKRFGTTFGPHRFRHAIASTAPLQAPEMPGLAAPLLGISSAVVEAHYDRANQVASVIAFQRLIEAK